MNDFKDYLAHHGILGMKWGIRRFRNYDGSLTNAGRKRYDSPRNLRYKKTAKEQEARKEKRRTRAKQIAKGLAAAALVGGAGYAAYKLSKKAFGRPSKVGHDPITQAFRESRGEDPMSKWMKWKNGLETRGGDDDKYYKDTIDNMEAGLPFYVKDKNGKPKLVSDPAEIKRLRDEFDEITEKRAAEWRAKAGYTDDSIKEPDRVTVNRVEPNRVPINKVEPNRASVNRVNASDIFRGDDGDHQRFQEFMTNPKYKDATLYFDGKMPTDERSKRRIAKHISRQVEKLEGDIDREGKEIAKAKKAARKISDGLSEAEEKLRRRK